MVAYILIAGAVFYLIGMTITICLKKRRESRRNSEEEASTDSNFDSIEDYTESLSEFETTERSSCVSVSEPGWIKDTMSNSSIGKTPMLKVNVGNYETQRYGVSGAKKMDH